MFAAYYDQRRNQRNIRIIAATKTRGPERVWCRLWYKVVDGNSTVNISKTVPAKLKVSVQSHKLIFSVHSSLKPSGYSWKLESPIQRLLRDVSTKNQYVSTDGSERRCQTKRFPHQHAQRDQQFQRVETIDVDWQICCLRQTASFWLQQGKIHYMFYLLFWHFFYRNFK